MRYCANTTCTNRMSQCNSATYCYTCGEELVANPVCPCGAPMISPRHIAYSLKEFGSKTFCSGCGLEHSDSTVLGQVLGQSLRGLMRGLAERVKAH